MTLLFFDQKRQVFMNFELKFPEKCENFWKNTENFWKKCANIRRHIMEDT